MTLFASSTLALTRSRPHFWSRNDTTSATALWHDSATFSDHKTPVCLGERRLHSVHHHDFQPPISDTFVFLSVTKPGQLRPQRNRVEPQREAIAVWWCTGWSRRSPRQAGSRSHTETGLPQSFSTSNKRASVVFPTTGDDWYHCGLAAAWGVCRRPS
jgi:hypothetical protein